MRKILSNREKCCNLVPRDYPVHINKEIKEKDYRILDGHFLSPMINIVPGTVPKEAEVARFQMILPLKWKNHLRPICVHLAGTGDHGFWRRRTMLARPLLKSSGIGSILLENPYYGVRKPKEQSGSALQNVTDLFVMGGCLVLESLVLFNWCERQGFGPLGITGISMGGHMASLAAGAWNKPVALIPCLSWSTASGVFTKGVLSGAIDWNLLQNEYKSKKFYGDFRSSLRIPEHESAAFCLGREFAKGYPNTVNFMEKYQSSQLQKQEELDILAKRQIERYQELSSKTNEKCDHEHLIKHFQAENAIEQNFDNPENLELTELDVLAQRQVARHYEATCAENNESSSETANSSAAYQMFKFFYSKKQKPQSTDKPYSWRQRNRHAQQDALDFMRGVMDEFTHISNFSKPLDTSLIIAVAADSDAYVPHEGVFSLQDVWPGCEVRHIEMGHIATFLLKQNVFRQAIEDAMERAALKYYGSSVFDVSSENLDGSTFPTDTVINPAHILEDLESLSKKGTASK